jgi:hypothetical protein
MFNHEFLNDRKPNGNLLTGVRDAMVAMIPPDTPPIDDQIARILLAKGYTVGNIAEHLDAVIEELINADYRTRGRYGDDED